MNKVVQEAYTGIRLPDRRAYIKGVAQKGCTPGFVPLLSEAMRTSLAQLAISSICLVTLALADKPLPTVPNAEIRKLPISSPEGQGDMLYYGTSNIDQSKVTRALVILHGKAKTAWKYMAAGQGAVAHATSRGIVRADEVYVMAPRYFTSRDSGRYTRPKNVFVWAGMWVCIPSRGTRHTNSRSI
jgi:hypothetical protein